MSILLRTEGLGKSFTLHLQGGTRIPVLAGVDLAVRAGECVALSGPSGAGKSTLMRCLYGNYGAGTGRILLAHRGAELDLASADPRAVIEARRESIGYVSQFLRVIPRVSTRDIVAEPMVARGMVRGDALSRASALLDRLNLPERLHSLPPATFSGGEQQRVNLARGFDAANRAIVIGLIHEAKQAGTAIVGIFHDAEVREAVADRVFTVEPIQDAA
jgi:alpha-D-ribose 1-methylphosphonate 5-triphosphate synthase subunit PhnL